MLFNKVFLIACVILPITFTWAGIPIRNHPAKIVADATTAATPAATTGATTTTIATTATTTTTINPCAFHGYFGVPSDCFKFIEFRSGLPHYFECPNGMSFHVDTMKCDRLDLSKCAKPANFTVCRTG